MLVREGTSAAVRRVASTATPVLLTVGFTVLLTGTIATIENVEGVDQAAKIPAATVLAPDGVPGLTDAAVTAQTGSSRLPTRVLLTKGGAANGGAAMGFDAAGVSDVESGLVLDPATARTLRAAAGTVLDLRWADGTAERVPVRAVRAAEPGVLLPRAAVRRHDPVALTDAVLLGGPPVAAAGARAMTARDYVQVGIDDEGQLVDLFLWVLIGLTVGYTGLAVANTLLMATAARRPEFGALRLAGATTAQVVRVTSAEAVLAVAVGTVLAAAVAGISLEGVRGAVEAELDRAVPLVIPWGATIGVTVACALVAVAATAGPVLRRRHTAGGS
jgi:putative ABC transport system permease protein